MNPTYRDLVSCSAKINIVQDRRIFNINKNSIVEADVYLSVGYRARVLVSRNTLIMGCDHTSEALHILYQVVHQEGLCPNLFSLANILSTYCESTCACLVASIHGYIHGRELSFDLIFITDLIYGYSRGGHANECRPLF